ncbi:HTH-type transcriptional activator Btr [Haloferula helveola]
MSRQVESSRLFWFNPDGESCSVVSGGYECCASDYRIERPGFQWYSLEFVVGGRGKLKLGDRETALRPGVGFIYGPGVPHEIVSDSEHHLRKYFAVFRGDGFSELLEKLELPAGSLFESTRIDAMRRALDEMISRGERRSKWSHELCDLLVRQALVMAKEDAIDAGLADTRAFRTFCRVRDFIEDNHLKVTTLEEIARSCELDAAYLCRLFSRFQDETPYQCLTRLRMEHAARRLLEGDVSVKQVSEELSFSDPFHFSRVFKSVHRVPPSRFRQGGRKS